MYLLENLSQYMDALNACRGGIFEYEDVVKNARIKFSHIEDIVDWNQEKYTRIVLDKNEDYELLLLCWEPGHITEIHDHNGQKGWIHVIQGELTEELFILEDKAPPLVNSSKILSPGNISHIHDELGPHRLQNNSDKRAISLHLYVKPVEEVGIYNERTGEYSRTILTSKII